MKKYGRRSQFTPSSPQSSNVAPPTCHASKASARPATSQPTLTPAPAPAAPVTAHAACGGNRRRSAPTAGAPPNRTSPQAPCPPSGPSVHAARGITVAATRSAGVIEKPLQRSRPVIGIRGPLHRVAHRATTVKLARPIQREPTTPVSL